MDPNNKKAQPVYVPSGGDIHIGFGQTISRGPGFHSIKRIVRRVTAVNGKEHTHEGYISYQGKEQLCVYLDGSWNLW